MTLHAGHSIPVTSDKADLYRRQKLLYAESVLAVAATKNNGGNTMNELEPRIHDEASRWFCDYANSNCAKGEQSPTIIR